MVNETGGPPSPGASEGEGVTKWAQDHTVSGTTSVGRHDRDSRGRGCGGSCSLSTRGLLSLSSPLIKTPILFGAAGCFTKNTAAKQSTSCPSLSLGRACDTELVEGAWELTSCRCLRRVSFAGVGGLPPPLLHPHPFWNVNKSLRVGQPQVAMSGQG